MKWYVPAALAIVSSPWSSPTAAQQGHSANVPAPAHFECGYQSPQAWLADVRQAVARGEIPDPSTRKIPPIRSGPASGTLALGGPCISGAHLFPFEDSAGVLLTNFSNGQLFDLMVDAANAMMATHGDNFDFVGYWVNFTPDHLIGAAFYAGIENDVLGIGDPTGTGNPLFNSRPGLGLGGDNIEGFVMMWDVNSSTWSSGTGPSADFTRLALGQEFEHRYAMFLPDLLDGRVLQGDNGNCGRTAHWNWKVDGQGSSMEISEWVGAVPSSLVGSFVTFNTDIPGSVFSYTDLYLMGYASPAEMDAGNSELRYMNTSDCSPSYNGLISTFSSADIVASAGPRIPDSTTEDQSYRTGWIMIHQPGDLPDTFELGKASAIMQRHQIDWNVSTLGRGTMNNTLFDDCANVSTYGCGGNPPGSLTVLSGSPSIGTTLTVGVDNPLGTQAAGSIPFLALATAPDPAFPCGTTVPGLGMSGAGELLLSLLPPNPLEPILVGTPWSGPGVPAPVAIGIPPLLGLTGCTFYAQGLLLDPSAAFGVKFGLTEGLEMGIGP